ncbi:MAG: hypothetical protein O9327_14945 [Polaromonas sp.]|nr:hypothetical protein [Polaromonas sp.]
MTDDLNRKLNAIVGAALRAMASTGVPDDHLGSFAAEHREKVAEILGVKPQSSEAPDLVAVVEEAVERVLKKHQPAAGSQSATPKFVRKTVLVNGQRTSITLKGETYNQLLKRESGKPRKAAKVLHQLAMSAPPDVGNRSGWVEARLQGLLQAQEVDAAKISTRH